MGQKGTSGRAAGTTALVAVVPEAEKVVGAARERYDPAAAEGVPAHLTVLYPFLPAERIDTGVRAALGELFAGHPPFEVRFPRFGRFPDLLWLAPEPEGPVRALTAAVAARWPEAPPYGGAFGDPAPHLTVAQGQSDEVYAAVEAECVPALALLRTRIAEVRLVVFDGVRWTQDAVFPLGGAPHGGTR
ncbi:2'-5' RNA ligase family protein [Streptomyces sp. NPDC087422]|uniref:2'-5' RNA ligase family protein n=1 Tax=Streptomyces sp. NPDC087422 TaxID=3365786 RepID=UPI0038097119